MIGNDIVDLSIAKIGEEKRRIRFMKKIFTDEEIDMVNDSNNETLSIWLLWSIKESVYKIVARQEKRIRYAPKSIRCQSILSSGPRSYNSITVYEGQTFHSKSIIKGDCIHTIASDDQVTNCKIQSATFNHSNMNYPSSFLDNQVTSAINCSQKYANGQISIRRDEMRIPRIYQHNAEIAILSLSRHGRYQGYAYLKLPN